MQQRLREARIPFVERDQAHRRARRFGSLGKGSTDVGVVTEVKEEDLLLVRCISFCAPPARATRRKTCLGTGAVIVMDKSTDLVAAIARFAHSYKYEWCGQCTPCRTWMMDMVDRFKEGRGHPREFDMLLSPNNLEGRTICALGDAAGWLIQGLTRHFRPPVEDRISQFRTTNGPVMLGGWLTADVDPWLALPNNRCEYERGSVAAVVVVW
ncbi:unnamed protein product [Peniophora sp. CBMAI 1063]|nr:unnamed protein product [Peniophora sp. CBMAI 1063]